MRQKQNLPFLLLLVSLTFFLCQLYLCPTLVSAQSAALYDLADILSSDSLNAPNITHAVDFTLPDTSLNINPTDYIQIDLTNFSSVTAPSGIVGSYGGTPSYSVASGIARVTGITVLAGTSLEITGITATNPGSTEQFGFTINITEDEAGSIIKNVGTGTAVQFSGTVRVTASIDTPQARVEISGYTSPYAQVFLSQTDNIMGTDVSGPTGFFHKVFTAINPGDKQMNVYSLDADSLATSIIPLSFTAPAYQTTSISNLLLSPTLTIEDTTILQAQPIYATGSAYPGTAITIFTDTPLRTYTASAAASGAWTYTISDTGSYTPGDYRIYTLAQTGGGLQSLVSPTILFTVSSTDGGGGGAACGDITQGDLNCDNIINLTDFSILMYYWGTTNATADMNSDSIVDLTDFSIMMYYWGT